MRPDGLLSMAISNWFQDSVADGKINALEFTKTREDLRPVFFGE